MRLGHPGYRTLGRFADGNLPEPRHRRVSDHLADCSRCRQEVAFIRQVGELARSLDAPPAPRAIFDRVLEQRAEGDRVLLPLEPAGRPVPHRHRWVMAATAVIVLLAAGLFLSTELLEADRAGLRFVPDRPEPGQLLRLSYDGGYRFHEAEHLRLRTRYRTGSGRTWEQLAAILDRDGETFTTELPLPDSVVYAVFAVEDLHGEQVDSRSGQLWEVVARAPDGRPDLAALDQRFVELFVRDELEAYRTALVMTELYPESARAWSRRWSLERLDPTDSIRRLYLDRFEALERQLTESPPADPAELAHMAWFALTLGRSAGVEYWIREASHRNARATPLYQARAARIRLTPGIEPGRALSELEALWTEAPRPVPAVADAGWHFAAAAADWDAAVRWLERLQDSRGDRAVGWHLDVLTDVFPATRVLDWALGPGRDILLEGPSGHRPLDRSVSEHARILAETRQFRLAQIARLAVDVGRDSVAAALAMEATPLGWNTAALEELGSILLAVGETTAAAAAYARVAADPVGGPIPDPVRITAGWSERVAAARTELDRRVLQDLVMRFLPDTLRPAGPGVTVFLSSCAAGHVRDVNRLADALPPNRLHVFTTPGIGRSPEELEACGLEPPARVDPEGAHRRAYVTLGDPDYFVTDSRGRIRFQHTVPAAIPRQLEALERAALPAPQS